MATELPFPLYSGFFPQMVLTIDHVMHYRRVSKDRVAQLMRIIDDADCIYRWTNVKARNNHSVQKAQFLELQLSTKQPASHHPSLIFKSSVHIVDVQADEILQALAKVKTRDARRVSSYLYGDDVVDTQTLLTFPTSSEHKKPSYSYRAIKWCLLKGKRKETQKSVDFCYVEYAGKRKARTAANCVVGFCVQESVGRDHEVPTLERYEILRGHFVRTGILITKTHQSNILKVTAIAQVDGALEPEAVRGAMEEIMVDYVAAVHRVKGLLERQRMGRLQYLDEWNWVAVKSRKDCAVCLRRFYFHRKYHCATCGEVVCSKCAPLRELEEPLDEQTHALRVCSVCMAQAGSHRGASMFSRDTDSEEGILETTTCTTNVGTEIYMNGLRYPKHRGLSKEDSVHPGIFLTTPEHSLRPHVVPSRSSGHFNGYDYESEGATSESVRRERSFTNLRYLPRVSTEVEKEALAKLVEHVRQIRDKISIAILEADEEEVRHSMMLNSGQIDDNNAERYDEIYDRFMKIRETLDISGLDIDNVLESICCNSVRRSLNTTSDRSEGGFALSYTEGADSEHSNPFKSERFEHSSPRSSLLSASARSLDHQDAGEPLPSPRPIDENAADDARALEEAIQWTRQLEPIGSLHSTGAPSPAMIPRVVSAKSRSIERLAQKIGRLQQRLESSQHVTDHPIVGENTDNEPEPESQVSSDPVRKPRDALAVSSSLTREQDSGVFDSRAPPDLVASLRGVMNSSELTHAPPRRWTAAASSPRAPSKLISSSRQFKRAPPPPRPTMPPQLPDLSFAAFASSALAPEQGTTIYVYEPQDQVQRVHRCDLDQSLLRESEIAEAGLDEVSSWNDQGEKANLFPLSEERGYARSTAASLQSITRISRNGDRDESGKLRELMEGLVKAPLRSRCSSGQSTGAPPTEKFDF